MSNYKKMLFIGGGNIAGAVACGLVTKKSVPAEYITVYDIDESKLGKFSKLGINVSTDLLASTKDAEYIFLAVKPGIVKSVMNQLSDIEGLLDRVIIISFAASVSIDHIEKSAGREMPVIRTMPSTPILVGEGVLAVAKNDLVSAKEFQLFCRTMSTIAYVSPVDESLMNPIISVHGSSPAYVYLFIKSMVDAAEAQGIDRNVALPLILKTIKGSVTMVERSEEPIDVLINNVASPNGTTLAALNSFVQDDFAGSVFRAMEACTKRANEISEEL